ncbi:hypothetical protein [Chitinophaga sp. RAB17]|uniref:hypothetical protein n=1 Tax=Chitinophaga sp. RAB17 TaxID=3233049 RepID=UPI003F907457
MNDYLLELNDLLSASRIRASRQRKRAAIMHQDKQMLKLYREKMALWEVFDRRGYVPLEPPIVKGYKRFFVLREDVARSKDAGFYQGILDEINTVTYCAEKSFRVSKRYKRRWRYIDYVQQLYKPDEATFKMMGFGRRAAECFEEVIKQDKRTKKPVKKYRFKEPWRFVLRVRPNIIMQRRAEAPELLARIDQINRFLDRNKLQPRLYKIMDGWYDCWRREWLGDCNGRYLIDRYLLPDAFIRKEVEEGIGANLFVNLKKLKS